MLVSGRKKKDCNIRTARQKTINDPPSRHESLSSTSSCTSHPDWHTTGHLPRCSLVLSKAGRQHLFHGSPSTRISSSGKPSLLVLSISRLPPIGKSNQDLRHAFQYMYLPSPPARRRGSQNVAQRVTTPRIEAIKPKTRVPMSSGPQ